MNALSLFSGIGGLDIAAEWAGFKTVAFCEQNLFCKKVLTKQWPGVKIYDDVRTINTEELPKIDLIHGGYPCQPFSVAGNQRGTEDERHLWPHMLRVVCNVRPQWVVAENVKGHIALGLDDVIDDLEGAGYTARPFVIPACAVGANHTRERVFIVAYSAGHGRYGSARSGGDGSANGDGEERTQQDWNAERCRSIRADMERRSHEAWRWRAEPGIRRVADGVPNRMDRLRALGNAVVPQQAYPIFAAIAETYNALVEAQPQKG